MLISEVSEQYDISPDTLRYYERIGLIPTVNRSRSGVRDFSLEDLKWLEFTLSMRSAGLSIDTLGEYMKLIDEGDRSIESRKKLLLEQRFALKMKIEELQSSLNRLDKTISGFEEEHLERERSLNGYESLTFLSDEEAVI